MFRKMRRALQQLDGAAVLEILESGSYGVLALAGDDGYPYAVPTSYVYSDGCLYFHCALSGHKPDAVKRCDKASFCVVAQDDVLPAEYTTAYKSVIAFGRVSILDGAAKRAAAIKLAEKYNPGQPENNAYEADKGLPHMYMLSLRIEHVTGKQGKALIK